MIEDREKYIKRLYDIEKFILDFYKSDDENLTNCAHQIDEYYKEENRELNEGVLKLENLITEQNNTMVRLLSISEYIKEQNDSFAEAMQWFCDRVEKGEVRSKKTYARFKELLDERNKGKTS